MTDPTNPAKVTDVVLERSLTPEETAVVPHWLDQAWTILQARMPAIPARIALPIGAPGALATAAVVQVLSSMVERKLRNPDGFRSWAVDDVVNTIDATVSTGQIYVTDDELAVLAVRLPQGGVYSLLLTR